MSKFYSCPNRRHIIFCIKPLLLFKIYQCLKSNLHLLSLVFNERLPSNTFVKHFLLFVYKPKKQFLSADSILVTEEQRQTLIFALFVK